MTISREGAWSHAELRLELVPGEGLLNADAVFPHCTAPSVRTAACRAQFEWLQVPYVGSDVLASAACMDKLTLKRLFAQAEIPQVDFVAAGRRAGASAASGWARCSGSSPPGSAPASASARLPVGWRRARRGGRAGSPARPPRDRRGSGDGTRGRVLSSCSGNEAGRRPPSPAISSPPTAIGTTTRTSTAKGGMELVVLPRISAAADHRGARAGSRQGLPLRWLLRPRSAAISSSR